MRRSKDPQDKFVHTLSATLHRLAQPLSIIQASLEISLLEPTSAEQYREVVKESLQELRRAADVVQFAAQLTRFQQPASDVAEVELSTVLEDTIDDLARVFETARTKLVFHRPEREHPVRISPTRLRQMFFYVLQAVRTASAPGDIIQIELRTRAKHVTLRISHEGRKHHPGIEDPSPDGSVADRALSLAHAIVTNAGGTFSAATNPLLIVADFVAAQDRRLAPAGNTKSALDGSSQFINHSH